MTRDEANALPTTTVIVGPRISADQLWAFYERNNICEVGFGKDVAARILEHPHVIVGAFAGEELVGLARATFDGLSACVMELSVDNRWQGKGTNGSLLHGDAAGLVNRLGRALLSELDTCGATFVSVYLVEGLEEPAYERLGFRPNEGHSVFAIDARSYTNGGTLSGASGSD
jgi:hypothetical protein